tara:strand:- start:1329 stop:1790 length:462 start_codon:yes stop_codon:yes gene_type:complete
MNKVLTLNAEELKRYQPNRYPFLMIDKVTEVLPGKYAHGYKNLTNNEWYFPKHFEGNPNMPGALQLESMAQMLTVAITTLPGLEGKVTHAIEHKVKFRKEVLPGDRLDIKADLISWKRGLAKGKAICTVEDIPVSSAEMLITIPEILKDYLPS